MLSCGRLRNTVNCVTSSCLTSLRVLHTAQLTVLCDYVSRNCCFCVLIRPSLTADRSIWLLLLQLQASVARSTGGFNPVWREKYLFAERYGKADVLTWFFPAWPATSLSGTHLARDPKKFADPCLKVTIICRYIFLRFWNSVHFTGIKFCVG